MTLKSKKELIHNFQILTEGIESYSLILLDDDGTILTWNKGAQKLKGYTAEEILGQHISMFYPPELRMTLPYRLLSEAKQNGKAMNTGRRIRKNGTIFWGVIEITAIKDENGALIGFTNLARELNDELDIGHFWFDNDGVLHTRSTNVPQTPERVQEFRETLKASLINGKICCVTDVRQAVLTDEGMSYAKPEIANIYRAVAFITDKEIDVNTKLMMSMVPKEVVTETFTRREDAKTWIRQFI